MEGESRRDYRRQKNILLEDNCESMGAKFADKQAGTLGIVDGFRAFFSHHISTSEGGLIKLNLLGFECRPITARNFVQNEVVKFFDSEVSGVLKNATHIDRNVLFVGNQHYPMDEAFEILHTL